MSRFKLARASHLHCAGQPYAWRWRPDPIQFDERRFIQFSSGYVSTNRVGDSGSERAIEERGWVE